MIIKLLNIINLPANNTKKKKRKIKLQSFNRINLTLIDLSLIYRKITDNDNSIILISPKIFLIMLFQKKEKLILFIKKRKVHNLPFNNQ